MRIGYGAAQGRQSVTCHSALFARWLTLAAFRRCILLTGDTVNGYTQKPLEGVSFRSSFADPDAPSKETQFFSMLGTRAIWHKGWKAARGRRPRPSEIRVWRRPCAPI